MKNRRGSLVGSVILITLGVLFLLGNIYPELRPWRLIARFWSDGWWLFAQFWPVIIILWGLSKLASYFKSTHDPAAGRRSVLSGGDIVLLVFLLIFGTTATNLTKAWRSSAEWSGKNGFRFGDGDFDFLDSGQRFEFSEEITQPVSGTPLSLEVNNRYGSVDVLVNEAAGLRVRLLKGVRAEDEAKGKEIADQLKIVLERQDNGYVLSTNRETLPDDRRRKLQTSLTVWVPKSVALKISNRFGPVSLTGVAGNHHVVNANGPVTVRNVEGNLEIENKYGPVRVSAIAGDCRIQNKYGPIEVEAIGGKIEIENAYGPVDLTKVKGAVHLVNRYGRVACADLDSTLTIDGRYVDVKGQNIGGDVQVTTSYKDIFLENVLGGITVKGKHGDIGIRSTQPPAKPIVVEAEYSGVAITLPKESQFELDATSKYGKFVSGFDSANLQESTEGRSLRVKGSAGRGGPTISISTTYRDITLNAS